MMHNDSLIEIYSFLFGMYSGSWRKYLRKKYKKKYLIIFLHIQRFPVLIYTDFHIDNIIETSVLLP